VVELAGVAVTACCRSCGCELQPWEREFCEGCGPLFLPATKGKTMSVRSRSAKIAKAVQAIGCQIEREHTAQTGSIYLTVAAPEGDAVVIRVSDHCDAYGTSDYTADGMLGTDSGAVQFVKKWLADQCKDNDATREEVESCFSKAKSKRQLRAKVRRLAKQYQAKHGDYLLMESGEQWYPIKWSIEKANAKDASTACLQEEVRRLSV
jgi:hypothetical protein